YHGFFLGIHEAMKALKARGILLAATGTGDEDVTRERWAYPALSPVEYLMRPEDFMIVRINRASVADNVRRICEELEAKAEEAVFVSTSETAREEVRGELPGILVLGDNPFGIRGDLLAPPSLQVADVREESQQHGQMVVSLLQRERARRAVRDPGDFLPSLGIRCLLRRHESQDLDRVYDLVLRTNQFTTTGRP